MAVPAPLDDPAPTNVPHESALHFFAREGQLVLRWTIGALVLITIGTMVTFYFWAILPATLLLVAFLALQLTNVVERRSAHRPDANDTLLETGVVASEAPWTEVAPVAEAAPARDESETNMAMPLLKHESKVVLIGVLALLVLAALVAGVIFGGVTMLLAIPFVFAYLLILGAPVWLAAIEDDIEDETARASAKE
jgi:hypothetical protein